MAKWRANHIPPPERTEFPHPVKFWPEFKHAPWEARVWQGARRRELFAELQSLVVDAADHPWSWAAEIGGAPEGGSRWNAKKDLSFVPLRPERVVEVRYDYLEGARFRHPPQFVRWRPDRDPVSCDYAQLEQPAPFDLDDVLTGRIAATRTARTGGAA